MSGVTHANKLAAQVPAEKTNRPSRDPTPGAPPNSALVPSGYLLLTIALERSLTFGFDGCGLGHRHPA